MTDEPAAPGRNIAPTSALLAIGFATAATATTLGSGLALSIAGAGVAAFALGLPSRSQFWCAFGTLALAAGILLHVFSGVTGWRPVAGITLAYLAWDRATHAISLGAQVGFDGARPRHELRQAAVPGVVGIVAILVPLATTRIEFSIPVVPLAVLLTAAVLLLSANRI